MNNTRRRQIRNEILTLETIRQLVEGYEGKYNGKVLSEDEVKEIKDALENASSLLSEVSSTIDDLETEERDCFDNLPEGLQMSEKGEAMEMAADNLETARDYIDDAESDTDDVISELEDYDYESELDVDFSSISNSIDDAVDALDEAME